MSLPQVVFWVMAVVAVLGGLGVVAFRRPINSVLSLVAVMLALSVIFLELSAQFVFAVQVIVYAGAVMVLFLFVVALLGPVRERSTGRVPFHRGVAAVVVLAFAGLLIAFITSAGIRFRAPEQASLAVFGTVQQIGAGLFTTYLYPFELTSILLLVAAVGAIYLSRGGQAASEVRGRELRGPGAAPATDANEKEDRRA